MEVGSVALVAGWAAGWVGLVVAWAVAAVVAQAASEAVGAQVAAMRVVVSVAVLTTASSNRPAAGRPRCTQPAEARDTIRLRGSPGSFPKRSCMP